MLYVTMTDRFMSGWGLAEGKINKLVFECDDLKEARIVRNNADDRKEMTYVNICSNKPCYNTSRYFTSLKTKSEAEPWYKENFGR